MFNDSSSTSGSLLTAGFPDSFTLPKEHGSTYIFFCQADEGLHTLFAVLVSSVLAAGTLVGLRAVKLLHSLGHFSRK